MKPNFLLLFLIILSVSCSHLRTSPYESATLEREYDIQVNATALDPTKIADTEAERADPSQVTIDGEAAVDFVVSTSLE